MRTHWPWLVVALAALGLLGQTQLKSASTPSDRINRGKYITHHVAMCVQCHTPRDDQGNLNGAKLFHGAPVPVESPFASLDWAVRAPHLAGLPGFTDDQVIEILTTGRATGRNAPKPPMPPFRLSRDDAEAVAAYLRSL